MIPDYPSRQILTELRQKLRKYCGFLFLQQDSGNIEIFFLIILRKFSKSSDFLKVRMRNYEHFAFQKLELCCENIKKFFTFRFEEFYELHSKTLYFSQPLVAKFASLSAFFSNSRRKIHVNK